MSPHIVQGRRRTLTRLIAFSGAAILGAALVSCGGGGGSGDQKLTPKEIYQRYFNIEPNMTYAQVVAVMGAPATTTNEDPAFFEADWAASYEDQSGLATEGSLLIVIFQNGHAISKGVQSTYGSDSQRW